MMKTVILFLLFLLSWSFNDGPLPSNVIVFDVSPMSSLLVLYATDSTNDGAFTCMATDAATGIVNEDTAYITVSGTTIICILYMYLELLWNY